METWQKVWIAVLATLVFGLLAFGFGFMLGDPGGPDQNADVIQDAYEKILDTAAVPPSEEELTQGAIKGMIRVLKENDDRYASFYDPSGYKDIQELTSGNFSGVGVSLQDTGNGLTVASVLPSSPAEKAGLKSGDIVTHADGKKIRFSGADVAAERIKGPAGTRVTLTILRGKKNLDFKLTRAELELPNVTARMTKSGNGYLRVFGFARGAGRQTRIELEKLIDKGADGILLDLRDNPGGLLEEAVNISSLFIEDGDVAIYQDSEGDGVGVGLEAQGDAFEDIPVVMLVNGGSASASEVVAGAMQDTERAQLVGTRTFGKASVQQVLPLADQSAVKLTTATYLTPDGRDINGSGITPDVVIEDPILQLRRAEELLENEIASAGEQG